MKTLNIHAVEITLLIFMPVVLCAGLTLHYINFPLYETVVQEDNIIEWLQFSFLFGAGFICLYRCCALFNLTGEKRPFWMYLVLGLIFLFGAGEEISWGQRLLGIESPDYFQEYNAQSEMNFHNLTVMGVKINKLLFGKILAVVILFYMIVLPVLAAAFIGVLNQIHRFRVPVPKTFYIAAFVLLVGILYGLDPERKGEWVEFVGTVIFFLIFLFPKYDSAYRFEMVLGSESSQDSEK